MLAAMVTILKSAEASEQDVEQQGKDQNHHQTQNLHLGQCVHHKFHRRRIAYGEELELFIVFLISALVMRQVVCPNVSTGSNETSWICADSSKSIVETVISGKGIKVDEAVIQHDVSGVYHRLHRLAERQNQFYHHAVAGIGE